MTDMTQVARRDESAVTQRQDEKSASRTPLVPAVDIYETPAGVVLWADLPGVSRDKLQVNVHDGNLQIDAEAVVPTPAGLRIQHAEIRQPHFTRTFALGPDLDATKIEANLQDGVLKLTIPRRDEARPRRIAVTVG
ncbi:Hsp20/alpha crystallin family protein [Cupriavidus sp. CuC1]|jgi:HSP20 family protein|uniref:Hsp20/alpha crystallin family protein n=1 Tax=Cupriavidus sp. CuC1 TaxID=3373131 RepID=UPI0037D50377